MAIAGPWLARRDLLTKLATQDLSRNEWRADVVKRLGGLEDRKQITDLAAMQAKDSERESAWWVWRRSVDHCIEAVANIPYRVEQLERLYAEYKDWKHEKADPYIGDYTALEKRVTRIERVMNGQIKP